ncbi:hypothetical protein QAD02_010981 [Eretmocerus hayati]|uniref:Uncharacterized protein n=1 Tax=Eretmocerus hayati TaxID=131215 RepID=A0ACC2P072_9HYME|nr:hypothetical protein QAD02_010981 [Eretmocerus hayati]
MDFVSTRATLGKRNAEKLHEVTVYEAHKKKKNPNKIHFKKENVSKDRDDIFDEGLDDGTENNEQPIDDRRKQELEMKKFRYDIIKFGMSGLEKQKARQAKVALAISLGAKPPKNKKKNYKRLIEQRKMEKVREKKKDKFVSGYDSSQITLTKHKNKAKTKSKDTKDKNDILGVYGKVTKDKKTKVNAKDRNKKNFKRSKK